MDGKYLTYNEYVALGGTLPQSAFSIYIADAEAKLNYMTFNRLSGYNTTPSEIKKLLVKFISILNDNSNMLSNVGVASYSNGIESFSYNNNKDSDILLDIKLYNMTKEYLIGYPDLLNRGVRWELL